MASGVLVVTRAMSKAVADMESFTECGDGTYKFVYRHGIVTSGPREGRLLGFFDASTENELEWKIRMLDRKFHVYTDTLVDREYDVNQDVWYATYAVMYPFDHTTISGSKDGQNAKPLF